MRRAGMIFAVVLALAVPTGAPAQTQAPNCEYEGGRSTLGLEGDELPKFVAWGQATTFESYMGEPETNNGYVQVMAADPARPIAHPYTAPHDRTSFQTNPLDVARGDGPVRIVVSWESEVFSDDGAPCRQYSEAVIETGEGRKPKATTKRRGEWVYPAGAYDCLTYSGARVTISVRGEGTGESFLQPGLCTSSYSRRGNSTYFAIAPSRLGAKFSPRKNTSDDDWAFRYTVAFDRRVVDRGRISVANSYRAGYRVYGFHSDGSINDEYWNYCVNEGKTVWMHNGNPYCRKPAWRRQRVTFR